MTIKQDARIVKDNPESLRCHRQDSHLCLIIHSIETRIFLPKKPLPPIAFTKSMTNETKENDTLDKVIRLLNVISEHLDICKGPLCHVRLARDSMQAGWPSKQSAAC